MWRVDLVLRFAYVLLAPAILAILAMQMPIAGVIWGTAAATAVAVFGADRWLASAGRIPIAGRFLRGMAKLGDYYDEHPPKPLVYYIAYPILAPFWLINSVARREFLVYRRLNALALVLLVATSAYDYLRYWRPIPFPRFAGAWIGMFIFQLLVTFALVMPIVTTVIAYHQRGLRKTLIALIAVTSLVAIGAGVIARARDPVSSAALMRLRVRTAIQHDRAYAALERSVEAAAVSFARAPDDTAAALAAARTLLADVYKHDELAAFRVVRADGVVIVYARMRRHPTIWIGRLPDGVPTSRAEQLSPAARALIGV